MIGDNKTKVSATMKTHIDTQNLRDLSVLMEDLEHRAKEVSRNCFASVSEITSSAEMDHIISSFVSGYNTSIVSCGMKETGNNFSMTELGRLAINKVFDLLTTNKNNIHIEMSFVELYNNNVRTLLSDFSDEKCVAAKVEITDLKNKTIKILQNDKFGAVLFDKQKSYNRMQINSKERALKLFDHGINQINQTNRASSLDGNNLT
jgi:hypothetical protein